MRAPLLPCKCMCSALLLTFSVPSFHPFLFHLSRSACEMFPFSPSVRLCVCAFLSVGLAPLSPSSTLSLSLSTSVIGEQLHHQLLPPSLSALFSLLTVPLFVSLLLAVSSQPVPWFPQLASCYPVYLFPPSLVTTSRHSLSP